MINVLLLAVVLDSHDLKSIPRHLEFGIWDEEFISGTSLWREVAEVLMRIDLAQ